MARRLVTSTEAPPDDFHLQPEHALFPFKIQNKILSGTPNSLNIENIGKSILEAFESAPDFIGQVEAETERVTTFREMREKSIKCALFMESKGIKQGDVITICICNHMDAYIPYLACFYIGAVADLWLEDYMEVAQGPQLLEHLQERMPKIIFTNSMFAVKFMTITNCIEELSTNIVIIHSPTSYIPSHIPCNITSNYYYLDNIIEDTNVCVDSYSCVRLDGMEPAVVMYSPSATSYHGNIKISHMMFTYPTYRQFPRMRRGDVGLWDAPFCSLHGPFLTVRAILEHVTALKRKQFDEKNMYENIEKYKVNWVFLESKSCNKMPYKIMEREYDTRSWREVVCESDVMAKAYNNLVNSVPTPVSVIKVYSMVQTGIIACQENGQDAGCGYVMQRMKIQIIDEDTRKSLGPHQCGEIWCTYPALNDNGIYYKRNKEFRRVPNARDQNRMAEGWYYTGDWGYFDNYGFITVIDKINNLLRFERQFFSSTILEAIIEECQSVKKAYILNSANDNSWSVYITPSQDLTSGFEKTYLLDFLRSSPVFPHGISYKIEFHTSGSYLPNGRIYKESLRN